MSDLDALARKANAQDAYWVEDDERDCVDYADYCLECAKKKAKESASYRLCGPTQFDESDSCRHCDTCGTLLHYVLTDHGVQAEMEHFLTYGVRFPVTPDEAYHLKAIEDQLPYSKHSWTD